MTAPCPNPRCEDGSVPGGEKGWLLCPDCKGTPVVAHFAHRTLYTTPDVAEALGTSRDEVGIIYPPSQQLPAIGDSISTSNGPDLAVADPIDVVVRRIIRDALVRGPEGSQGMRVNVVVGGIELRNYRDAINTAVGPPRSYPDAIENPVDPPSVGGTEITRPTP